MFVYSLQVSKLREGLKSNNPPFREIIAKHVENEKTVCSSFHIFFFSDEPEIEVEAEKVHSGVGKEAHLSCIVHGEPKPSVS